MWARGEGCLTGIFGPNRTYSGWFGLMYLLGPSTFSPIFTSSKTSSELHKVSRIKISLGASRRKGTQTNKGGTLNLKFSAFKVFTKDVISWYSKQDVRARCEGVFFARRFAPKCSPRRTSSELHKGTLQGALQGALQGYTTRGATRVTFKISLGFPA